MVSEKENGRERILKTLRGEPTAFVPVSPILFTNFVRKHCADPRMDIVEATTECYRRLGADIIHRNCFPALYFFVDTPGPMSDAWQVEIATSRRDDKTEWDTRIHTPQGVLTLRCEACPLTPNEEAYAYRELLIKETKDLDCLLRYEPRWTATALDTTPLIKARETVGTQGIVCPWVQGVFNFAGVFYRDYQQLLMDPYIDEGFYRTLMAHALEQNWSYLKLLLEGGADAFAYGGNLAGGQVGPGFFEQFVLSYEAELIRRIHEHGGAVIYHNCGRASALLELYASAGMDCFESLAQTPEGDCELREAKQRLGQRLCLAGGIDQKSFLVQATPQEVRQTVKETLAVMKDGGRYILSTVDYLAEDTPLENVLAFVEAGRDFGAF